MESSFRIGDWLVEPLQNRLVRGDTRVKLDPKVMQVLLYLAERPNEIAEKEKIIESVWEGTFVTDEVLTNAIWELRKAFGDDAKDPKFIQTVPRKGYRLIAPVQESSGGPSIRRKWVGVSAVLLGLGATLGSWAYLSEDRIAAPELRTVPLTGFAGAEWWPALSPDGKLVAFVWDRGKPGPYRSLHVQMIGVGDPLRLTDSPSHEFSPVWSPDGSEIAFLRERGLGGTTESDVLIIPALGGEERRLATVAAVDAPGAGWNPGMAWSPDGRFLAVVDRESAEEPHAVFLLSLESGEKQRLTFPSGVRGDIQPAFSPDGKTLAFARMPSLIQNQILLQNLDEREPKLLVTVEGFITDLDWTADGAGIVFASGSESEAGAKLWRVPRSGGFPEPLPFGEMAQTLSISRTSDRMVHDRRSWYNPDIWRIDGPAADERGTPTRLIASSRSDWAQEYSPDGTKIAFASERSGNNNIWVCESDGTRCIQLTEMARATNPRWSPDGKRLVFTGREQAAPPQVYVVDAEGRFTRRITDLDSRNFLASWSHDGRWIYFTSERTGEAQIWKMPAEGGEATQITRHGGREPRESSDARGLYFRADQPGYGLRQVPVDGGVELPIHGAREFGPWTLWRDDIVYATTDRDDPRVHLEVLDQKTNEVKRLFSSSEGLSNGMTVSPDGRWILVSINEPDASDIMLVEGFR